MHLTQGSFYKLLNVKLGNQRRNILTIFLQSFIESSDQFKGQTFSKFVAFLRLQDENKCIKHEERIYVLHILYCKKI